MVVGSMLWIRYLLLALPLLFALLWSCKPALYALAASFTFEPREYSSIEWEQNTSQLDFGRSIQKHFRKFDIYIPLDDIMYRPHSPTYQEKLFLQLDQACGHGNVYVWVPLYFRFPLKGNKALEWCWIPQLKIGKKSDQ